VERSPVNFFIFKRKLATRAALKYGKSSVP
jgi:hypothetical protein